MCCETAFPQLLHERGLRVTPQREIVLRALHRLDHHATVEQVFGKVRCEDDSIDISTVYRTLDLLHQLQLVGSLDLDDGQRRYELLSVHGPHHHLYCRACGRLLRIEAEAMAPSIDQIAATWGFSAQPEHLVIPGLCQDCQRAGGQTLAKVPVQEPADA